MMRRLLPLLMALLLTGADAMGAAESPCNRDLTRDPLIVAAIEAGRIDVSRVDFGTSGIAMAAFEADGFFMVQLDEQLRGEQAEGAYQNSLCTIRGLLAGDSR